MQPGSRSAGRDAEGFTHLNKRQADVVMKHEHRPLFDTEAAEGAVQRIAFRDGQEARVVRRVVELESPNIRAPLTFGASTSGTTKVVCEG